MHLDRAAQHNIGSTAAGRLSPAIISGFQRLTQRFVKFIRWLRQNLWSGRPQPELWAIRN